MSSACNFSDHPTSGQQSNNSVSNASAVAAAARHYSSLYSAVSTTSEDLVTSGTNTSVSQHQSTPNFSPVNSTGSNKFLTQNLTGIHPLSMAAAVYESQYRTLTTKQWPKYHESPSPSAAETHQTQMEHSANLAGSSNNLGFHSGVSPAPYGTPPPAHSGSLSAASRHHHHHYLASTLTSAGSDAFGPHSGSYLLPSHLSQAALAAAANASNSVSTTSSNSSSGFGAPDSFPSTSGTGVRKYGRRPPNPNRIPPQVKASDEYKMKRERNNIAVRKSREKSKRRQKDNESRAQELIAENELLRHKCNVLSKMTEGVRVLLTTNGVPHEKVSIELSKVIQDLQDHHTELDPHGPGSNQSSASGLLGVQHEFSFPLTGSSGMGGGAHHFGAHQLSAGHHAQAGSHGAAVAAAAAAVAAGHPGLPVGAAASAAAAAAAAAAGQSMHHSHLQHHSYHPNASSYH